jgi:hypothetical protein
MEHMNAGSPWSVWTQANKVAITAALEGTSVYNHHLPLTYFMPGMINF